MTKRTNRGFLSPAVLGGLFVLVVIAIAAVIGSSGGGKPFFPLLSTPTPYPGVSVTPSIAPSTGGPSADLKTFKSFDEISLFLKSSAAGSASGYYRGYGVFNELPMMTTGAAVKESNAAGAPAPLGAQDVSGSTSASDFSGTNVQVKGVDEPDVVKNDGKYIYTVTNGNIIIVDAFPPAQGHVVSILNSTRASSDASNANGGAKGYSYKSYVNVFVSGDQLVAFGDDAYNWGPIVYSMEKQFAPELAAQTQASSQAGVSDGIEPSSGSGASGSGAAQAKIAAPGITLPCLGCGPYPYYGGGSFVEIYDIKDRANPTLVKTLEFRGSYQDARLIGSNVFAVFNENAFYGTPRPLYAVDGAVRDVAASDVQYIDYPYDNYQFTTVIGVDLSDLSKAESRKVVLMGAGENLFVSTDNVYVASTRYSYYRPLTWNAYQSVISSIITPAFQAKLDAIDANADLSEWRKDNLKSQVAVDFLNTLGEKDRQAAYDAYYNYPQTHASEQAPSTEWTVVHKFALNAAAENAGTTNAIAYEGKGEVPGHVLNQFSMDESNGYFRIATTAQAQFNGLGNVQAPQTSAVYVLDSNLKTVGSLTGLAPGEQIYSARFMGNRAYLVTFRQVDPLFVIDLSDPTKPDVLGKLKIPGYSNYLHPYDDTHLIGLGMDSIPNKQEMDYAIPLGVKLSLFDVSDVANPTELSSFVIGDHGTSSIATQDHKAFLFDKTRGLLVIPIVLSEVPAGTPKFEVNGYPVYGTQTFSGAYVFNVSLAGGFQLRGRISHVTAEEEKKAGDTYYDWYGSSVQRSLYMDNDLYTVSNAFIKANDLTTLAETGSIALPTPAAQPYPYPYLVA